MIFIKYISLILILGTSSIIGNILSKKYLNRCNELKEIEIALNLFETKIKFTYESIPNIFNEIYLRLENEIGKIFLNTINFIDDMSMEIAWETAIDKSKTDLLNNDKKSLKSLGKLLGQTDLEGQINQIELVKTFIKTQLEEAIEEKNRNEKMYKKLGIIIGIAIVIILI